MNAVKCPNCGNPNAPDDNFCLNCGSTISVLNQMPNTYSPLAEQQPNQPYQSYNFNVPSNFNMPVPDAENRLGQNVYIGYKVFCGATVLMSLVPIFLGIIAILGNGTQPTPKEQQDAINGGIMFIAFGLLYLVPYGFGLIMPKSRVSWFIGTALLILSLIPSGFTSCLFIPAAIALLIFWFRAETRSYFERK